MSCGTLRHTATWRQHRRQDEVGRACALGLPGIEVELQEGERALMQGQGLLHQINVQLHKTKLLCCYAWNTLLRLKEHGLWEKVLRTLEEDVQALSERAMTEEEKERRKVLQELGEVVEGGIRMKQIEFGYWAVAEWVECSVVCTLVTSNELQEGLVAYVREQTKHEITMCALLEVKWAGIRQKEDNEGVVPEHNEYNDNDEEDLVE
ncbi:hypothetical protein C8R44DRAFT_727442 [Mycena epipterygia]|nr:hypothetical protein C8R44DRAFT_727442 [Mycena epipterygia]